MGAFGGQPAPGCQPSADGRTCGHTKLSSLVPAPETCPHHLSLPRHSQGQGSGVTASITTDVHTDAILTWSLAAVAAVRHVPLPKLVPLHAPPPLPAWGLSPLSQPLPRAGPVQYSCPPRGLRLPGYVDINLLIFGVNIKDYECWIIWQGYV